MCKKQQRNISGKKYIELLFNYIEISVMIL